jgi:outer membrane protein TolC
MWKSCFTHKRIARTICRVQVVAALFVLGPSVAFADEPMTPGSNVDSLLAVARAQNPEYAALRHEAQAAEERVYPAGAFPDPYLERELEAASLKAGGGHQTENGTSAKFKIAQEIPFWGKRELRRETAAAAAAEARGRAEAAWNELAARIKSAYAQYYVIARTEALTREILEILIHLEHTAQARYLSGIAPQQDAILAQAEQTITRTDLVNIETERRDWQYRINALLRRSPDAHLAEPEHLRPIPAAEKLAYAALEGRLKAKNPQLFVDAAGITAAEKNRELTYRNRWPDGALGVTFIRSADNRIVLPGLYYQITIPLQQPRRRSDEREAEEKVAAANERRAATESQLEADLARGIAVLEGSMRTQNLLQTSLVPQAELSFRSAQAGYEAGRMAFGAQLDAQRQIRKAKLDLLKSEADAQVRLAEIERLIGEDL